MVWWAGGGVYLWCLKEPWLQDSFTMNPEQKLSAEVKP